MEDRARALGSLRAKVGRAVFLFGRLEHSRCYRKFGRTRLLLFLQYV